MSALALDPLIAEAKERARRRRYLAAGILALALAGTAAGVVAVRSGGSPGTVPWIPAKPNIGPAHPPLAPPCVASQLRASMSFSAGAGMLFGRMTIVNRSSTACALVGRPQLSFGDRKAMKWGPNPGPDPSVPFDPLAPPVGSLRALAPGRSAAAGLFWGGACDGYGAGPAPQTATMTAPGGGVIRLHPSGVESCGNSYSGSVPAVDRFTPVVPEGPRSSKLPLGARIVSTGPPFLNGYGKPLPDAHVLAHSGSWLSFTVVLTNKSEHPFRFGRTCPAYTEGDGGGNGTNSENQAYVLNCHAVGPIAPHASVAFAMRVYVPKSVDSMTGLLWTLAPHSYNAPQALTWLNFPGN